VYHVELSWCAYLSKVEAAGLQGCQFLWWWNSLWKWVNRFLSALLLLGFWLGLLVQRSGWETGRDQVKSRWGEEAGETGNWVKWSKRRFFRRWRCRSLLPSVALISLCNSIFKRVGKEHSGGNISPALRGELKCWEWLFSSYEQTPWFSIYINFFYIHLLVNIKINVCKELVLTSSVADCFEGKC